MRSEIFWFIFGFVILEFVPSPGPHTAARGQDLSRTGAGPEYPG